MNQNCMSVSNLITHATEVASISLNMYLPGELADLDADEFANNYSSGYDLKGIVVDEERDIDASRIEAPRAALGSTVLCVKIPLVKGLTLDTLITNPFRGSSVPVCEAFDSLKFDSELGLAIFNIPDQVGELDSQLPRILEYFENLNKEIACIYPSVLSAIRSAAENKINEAKSELKRREEVDSQSSVQIVDRTSTQKAQNDWS